MDSKNIALQLGLQIEQLAVAMDGQDIGKIHALAETLEFTAQKNGVVEVQNLAAELSELAVGEPDLHQLVSLTRELLDLCRSAQLAHIDQTPEAIAVDNDRRTSHNSL